MVPVCFGITILTRGWAGMAPVVFSGQDENESLLPQDAILSSRADFAFILCLQNLKKFEEKKINRAFLQNLFLEQNIMKKVNADDPKI